MRAKKSEIKAVLKGATPPSATQKKQLISFLEKNYNKKINFSWQEDLSLIGGFRMEVGSEVYDWSIDGRFTQLKDILTNLPRVHENIVPLLKDTVTKWTPDALAQEIGHVVSVGDGIATVSGLKHSTYGEILIFSDGIRGMVQQLNRDEIGCILFGDDMDICAGSLVRRTGKTAGIPVGDEFMGRVIDALGDPIDGKGPIKEDSYRPIEKEAPDIIDRQTVNRPMETGILVIDSMFPIGRGQRELIIGDRQTGKTAIALDTILNQKDKDVICIYVAIGQKNSSVAQISEILRRRGALSYTIIINASASDAASLQYIAPYAGCAMGEYFMEQGKDVLIIFDDLSKHAIAYRTISLLLERSPGREAYPGDIFYLHSRLLERSGQLSDAKGGGSMTALPIVETQAGDISAYIPTNIISITDGQIFLESDLFFAGQRPAVNIGLSVSRVGGNAQTKAMRTAAGTIRLDLAQYREIEVFTQFSSDLDDTTKRQLAYGQNLMLLLKQEQYHPMQQYEQVITLIAMLNNTMQDIPHDKVVKFCQGLTKFIEEKSPYVCREINGKGKLSDKAKQKILNLINEYRIIFKEKK